MKSIFACPVLLVAFVFLVGPVAEANDAWELAKKGTLIFHDDFTAGGDRQKWATNDERAKRTAPKTDRRFVSQVSLSDGVMQVRRTEGSDHGASVQKNVAFRDGVILLKYRTTGKNNFSFNVNDRADKTVHAGHLFKVQVDPTAVQIVDQKTGNMALTYRELRDQGKAGDKKAAAKATGMLKGKTAKHAHKNVPSQWHELAIIVKGDTVAVEIDGKRVGKHVSAGFGHATKSMVAFAVSKAADFDDLKIYKLD